MKKWLQVLLIYAGIPLGACILWLPLILIESWLNGWLMTFIIPALTVLAYVLLRKVLSLRFAAAINAFILIVLSICSTVLFLINDGSVQGVPFTVFWIVTFPFFLPSFLMQLTDTVHIVLICIFLTYGAAMLACLCMSRKCKGIKAESIRRPTYQRVLPYLLTCTVFFVCAAVSLSLYVKRPEVRYAGHGFDYMNGYSSTDFTDYTVYAAHSRLVKLDHEPDLIIENEQDMPVMDGAEACYPLYAALAKTVYRDIDKIELNAQTDDSRVNGKIVTFTNTVVGFERLLDGEADLFFGARPSKDQLKEARRRGIALTVTPIGREGFVFFVEADNPVENLSSEQIRAIYHGDIANWKEVGGKDQKIKAFQRPQNSGSQTMMEYFMGNITLKEPDTYDVIGAMEGVIQKVAQYANEEGAMGYSFRYFVEGLNQEKNVKLLSVDGVAPSLENIESGLYPLTVDLCLITRSKDPDPNIQKMIDFILSEDGQQIVRKTGYAELKTEK